MERRTTTNAQRYARVNAVWASADPLVYKPLSPAKAKSAARRVYRLAFGKPWKGRIIKGVGPSEIIISMQRTSLGLKPTMLLRGQQRLVDVVHGISHEAHRRLRHPHPEHGMSHAAHEHDLVQKVLSKPWVHDLLKVTVVIKPAPKPKHSLVVQRGMKVMKAVERAEAAIKTLERKLAAKQKQLAKLKAKEKYYGKKAMLERCNAIAKTGEIRM